MGMSISRARAETLPTAGEEGALQAGTVLARQYSAAAALAEVGRMIAALKPSFARGLTADIQIGSLIPADLHRLQGVAADRTSLQAMKRRLEAEREQLKLFAEIAQPCMELRMQTIGPDRSDIDLQLHDAFELIRPAAKACAPRIADPDLVGNQAALADLHVPVRIHAVPGLPLQSATHPARCREAFLGKPPLSPAPDSPTNPEWTGCLDDGLDDEGARRVLEQLSRFVRSEEIPSDAREGMDFLLALWKLKKTDLSKTERHSLHLTVVDFLRQQIGVLPPAGGHQQLASGLLVPHPHGKTPTPELAPEIYTTQQLAKKLHSTEDTLKRHAKKAWENGPLPQPMPEFLGWFVVAKSNPKGGQGCGWKFQQRVTV